jgi:hypothetical protein
MSNHKIVKIRSNDAAIVFTNDRGFDVITTGPLQDKKMAQAFAVCYAVVTHNHVFDAFKKIIVKDMEIRKKHTKDLRERMQRQQLIDLLSEGLEDEGGEEDGNGKIEQEE